MRLKSLFLYILILSFALWLIGFCFFVVYTYSLQYSKKASQADAVIVLTGGQKRLAEGIHLWEEKKAPLLFISGVNEKVDGETLKMLYPQMENPFIDLDYDSQTTFENAIQSSKWVESHHVKSAFLVTSFYHMPRALFEFSKMIPELRVYPVCVFLDSEMHWTRTRSAWLVFEEYNKYIIRYIQFQIRRIFL